MLDPLFQTRAQSRSVQCANSQNILHTPKKASLLRQAKCGTNQNKEKVNSSDGKTFPLPYRSMSPLLRRPSSNKASFKKQQMERRAEAASCQCSLLRTVKKLYDRTDDLQTHRLSVRLSQHKCTVQCYTVSVVEKDAGQINARFSSPIGLISATEMLPSYKLSRSFKHNREMWPCTCASLHQRPSCRRDYWFHGCIKSSSVTSCIPTKSTNSVAQTALFTPRSKEVTFEQIRHQHLH